MPEPTEGRCIGAAAAYRARGRALPLPVAYTIRLGDMKVLKRSVIHNRLGSTTPGEHCMELGPCPQLETMRVIGSMDIVDHSSDERLQHEQIQITSRSCVTSTFGNSTLSTAGNCCNSHCTSKTSNSEVFDEMPPSLPPLELPKPKSMQLRHSGSSSDTDPLQTLNRLSPSFFNDAEARVTQVMQ